MLDHSGIVWNFCRWEEISYAGIHTLGFVIYGQKAEKKEAIKEAKKLSHRSKSKYLGVEGEKSIINE
jgi:hypothetical protein